MNLTKNIGINYQQINNLWREWYVEQWRAYLQPNFTWIGAANDEQSNGICDSQMRATLISTHRTVVHNIFFNKLHIAKTKRDSTLTTTSTATGKKKMGRDKTK